MPVGVAEVVLDRLGDVQYAVRADLVGDRHRPHPVPDRGGRRYGVHRQRNPDGEQADNYPERTTHTRDITERRGRNYQLPPPPPPPPPPEEPPLKPDELPPPPPELEGVGGGLKVFATVAPTAPAVQPEV
ncbi:hypothetical protein EV651_114253 [Kribbella sp. VKM Ac-2571]|nr:hypothetical protein EV651_114253 [Kribbella sp. VKM Ac-2571]